MPKLAPFRIANESDVVNLFGFDGPVASTVEKGTLVKIKGSGAQLTDSPVGDVGTPGASFGNTVSIRYGATWKLDLCTTGSAGTKDEPLGVTLWDVRETDENGSKLLFSPQKQAELQAVLSGQAVPVLTRGIVSYSGTLTSAGEGSVAANVPIYAGAAGELVTSTDGTKVGKTLGAVDGNLHVLLKLEL
jgi:hypothetical protein